MVNLTIYTNAAFMKTDNVQENFFRQIKQKLDTHLSLADEIAALLNISQDSAYRRIRGEKPLTIDEIQLLAGNYSISLDSFMNIKTENFVFSGAFVDNDNFRLENYMQEMINHLTMIKNAEQKHLYYLNKDIPIFLNFMFPELACFKCYFWSRYFHFNKTPFLISDFIDMFNATVSKIYELYLAIPSTEIWNLDCINTTIRQIEFYRQTKVFQSADDIRSIYNCLEKLVDHLEQQAEYGYKFPYKEPSRNSGVTYSLYANDFVFGDNTVIAQIDDTKVVFLNHSVINYIITTNKKFVDYVFETFRLVQKKSTLISNVGERERQLFFENIRQKIHDKKMLMN